MLCNQVALLVTCHKLYYENANSTYQSNLTILLKTCFAHCTTLRSLHSFRSLIASSAHCTALLTAPPTALIRSLAALIRSLKHCMAPAVLHSVHCFAHFIACGSA